MIEISLRAPFSRRIPDPVFRGCYRHIFMCPVEDVPSGIPDKPNPREQNIDRGIYRTIKKHLLNQEGEANTFHLKNKGISILADAVEEKSDGEFILTLSDGQGIVDGGHTYDLIVESREDILQKRLMGEAINQLVKIEVLTGYPSTLVTEIAGGLNTAVQVQQMSLENLSGKFEWIKDELQNEPYFQHIAFREGEGRLFDVRDVLVLLDLFNITEYPNDFAQGLKYPLRAYNSKESVLKSYKSQPQNYERLRPILKNILVLHDTISLEATLLYNQAGGRAGGKLKFVEYYSEKTGKQFDFPFIGQKGDYRLFRSALFPMLGAFRYMIDETPDGGVKWRGDFRNVVTVWREVALPLMEATKGTCQELGYNLNAIGKSQNHWQSLYFTVLQKAMQLKK